MNLNTLNLPALRSWLALILVIWLLGFIGLGWLVKSLLVLMGLILLTPVMIFVALRWWLSRNLVQEACPSCGANLTGINNTQTRCYNCNQVIQVQNNHFQRPAQPGTIDVQAVDVSAQLLDD